MNTVPQKKTVGLVTSIFLAGALPLLLYWMFVGQSSCSGPTEVRQMPLVQQWLVVVTAFGIKPIYLLISLVVIIRLWRQRAPDLTALRRGLIVFWLGENACAANYLFFGGHADLWEFFHDYGMAVAFSFITFAVMEGIDARVLKYSVAKERCAMLNLCHTCIKYTAVSCKLRRMLAMSIPALIAVAFMPLCASLKLVSYNVTILGSVQDYSHPMCSQLFETRYCAVLAIALLTASWAVLLFKREDPITPAKVLLAAAAGPMGFGLMRLFLYSAYSDNLLWFEEWEEFTELLFTIAVAYVLWLFRHSLFQKQGEKAIAIEAD